MPVNVGLNVIKSITITMGENDVKEIVAEYLRQNGYNVNANDVTLSVGMEWTGYGMDERQVARFKECSVVLKEK